MSYFKEEISRYIQCAFDNEKEFLEEFFPEAEELDHCYMAKERTLIGLYMKEGSNETGVCTETIPTSDFISWVDTIL